RRRPPAVFVAVFVAGVFVAFAPHVVHVIAGLGIIGVLGFFLVAVRVSVDRVQRAVFALVQLVVMLAVAGLVPVGSVRGGFDVTAQRFRRARHIAFTPHLVGIHVVLAGFAE